MVYGMDARYRRGAPGVRDAFSKPLGAKNRRFRYGRDIRYQKPPSYGTGLTLISEERCTGSSPPPGCPKSPLLKVQSAFWAILAGVELTEGVLFGQAPPGHKRKILAISARIYG